jgi:hypothetical protein
MRKSDVPLGEELKTPQKIANGHKQSPEEETEKAIERAGNNRRKSLHRILRKKYRYCE